MHVRDRLRATLAHRRASQICWSCSCFSTQQHRSLQTAVIRRSLQPENNTPGETEAPHPKSLYSTTRRIKHLEKKSSPSIHDGRTGRIPSGDRPPPIISSRPRLDGKTGAQVWPSLRAPSLVSGNSGGDKKSPRNREHYTREKVIKSPRIRKYAHDKIRLRRLPAGQSFRVFRVPIRTLQPLNSDHPRDGNRPVPVPRVTTEVACQEKDLGQTGSFQSSRSQKRHVKRPRVKRHRSEHSTLSSAPSVRKQRWDRGMGHLLTRSSARLSLKVYRNPSVPIRKLRQLASEKWARYPELNTEAQTMRSRRLSRPTFHKRPGATQASTKFLASPDDDVPVFIDGRRNRRYVIQEATGREAHIQYEPYIQLTQETEDLLQLWVQAPAPSKSNVSSQRAKFSQWTSRSIKATLEPSASMTECMPSTSASGRSQCTVSAATACTNLPSATLQQSAASPYGNLGLQNPLPTADWPVKKSKIVKVPTGHLTRFPTITAARALHTAIIMRQQVESQSIVPAEANGVLQLPKISEVGIRKHLRLWQELQNEVPVQISHKTGSPVTRPIEDGADIVLETSDNSLHDDLDTFNAMGVDPEGDIDDQSFLRSGDVIAMSTTTDSLLAVFTRIVGNQAQFYNVQGKWIHKPVGKVFHTIPQMFSLEELEPILPYLPTEDINIDALNKFHQMDASIPRSVGAKLLEKLQSFQQASADVYRDHLGRIDRVHSLVAHEWQRRELSLREITSIVLQKPDQCDLTEVELYTLHKVLIKDSKFRPQVLARHRIYPIWKVNPLNQIRDYEKVKQWLRAHLEGVITRATSTSDISSSTRRDEDVARANPVSRFIKKARNLIQTSRMHRKVTTYASIGPSDQHAIPAGPSNSDAVVSVSTLVPFDAEERIIIEYLKDWALSNHMPRLGSTWSLSPMLLRAIGMYEGYDLAEGTGTLLLRELGVIAPWENDALYSPIVRIPCKHDPQTLQLLKNASNSVDTIVQSDETLQDSLEGLRTDWGNTNVYCVDRAGAREIDDGLSVEKIDAQGSISWIHVHIANPAAFIKPGSTVAQYAETVMQTHYFPEKRYPMLNPRLAQRQFSLAKDRPVLTFSAKITTDGEILATKVTPGWIRKIKKLTPDRIHRELGLVTGARPFVSHTLTVGQHVAREVPDGSEDTPLSSSEISELRLLHRLGAARRFKRSGVAVTELAFANQIPQPEVFLQPDGMDPAYSPKCARRFIGDPVISWEAREATLDGEVGQDDGVAMFVTELMLLAGEIAARWCGARNIPIPYRGTIRNPSIITTPEAYKAQVLDPMMGEMGYVPPMYRKAYNVLIGTARLKSSPFPHALLDTEAYTKATSPLRRYPDMVVHWQIQAALRHEALHGQEALIGSTDDSYLPFSRADMDALLPTIAARELAYKGATMWSTSHWIMQLLHRAFEYKQAPLPSVFDVQVKTEKSTLKNQNAETMVSVKQLSGFDADLLENDVSSRQGGFRLGDWWQARIERAETYRGRLIMIPIRLTARIAEDITARYKNSIAYRLYQPSSRE